MIRTSVWATSAAIVLASSCAQAPGDAPTPKPVPSAVLIASSGSHAGEGGRDEEPDYSIPKEKFADPQRSFDEVKKILLSGYYDPSITEESLYRAAVAGMLERVDPSMRKWNKLLSPSDLAEIHRDLSGEIVGIGVKIYFDPATGYSDVLAAVPGTPAAQAGLAPPDKIVTVDGKLYKGRTERDVVADIRGKAGESVTLSVLRGDRLLSVPLVRAKINYDPVNQLVLEGDVGYVHIPSFNASTPDALAGALQHLGSLTIRALVVDVRECPGGSFDDAVAAASELLPAGATVATLKKRGATDVVKSRRAPVLTGIPIAVLVNHDTSSGAELIAIALQEGVHALLVGEKTYGKWTVQTLADLPNGYAFKYTQALFQSPSGKSFEGTGLPPDVEVNMPMRAVDAAEAISDPVERLAADVQLRTAVTLLRRDVPAATH